MKQDTNQIVKKMSMPKVSVIIPVYNTEKYLSKCLDSLTAQTLKDIEIICINDCSPDGSLAILQKYAESDDRIKVIDFKENKGVSIARNTGIDAATGDYIGFVDSDDFVDLDFYEKLYNKAVEDNSDLVVGNIRYIIENDRTCHYSDFIEQVKNNKVYFNVNFTTAIYRKELLSNNIRFTAGTSFGEDRELPIKAMCGVKEISIIDSVYYNYVKQKNSTTNTIFTMKKAQGLTFSWINIFSFLNTADLTEDNYYKLSSILLKEYCDLAISNFQDRILIYMADEYIKLFKLVKNYQKLSDKNLISFYELAKQKDYAGIKKIYLENEKKRVFENLRNRIKKKA